MSHQDNSVFVDTSGRRGRVMRWGAAGVGIVCVGFLGIVVAGMFGAGPTGGPLPWSDDDTRDAPALIQPDPEETPSPDGSRTPSTARPARTAGGSSASASPSAAPTSTAATEPSAKPSTTAPSDDAEPTPTATGGGSGDDTTPGKSGNAPGATKRPR